MISKKKKDQDNQRSNKIKKIQWLKNKLWTWSMM